LKLASARKDTNRDASLEPNHVKATNNDNSPDKNTASPVATSAHIETNRDASVETNQVKPVNNDKSPDKAKTSPAGTYKFTSLTMKLARLKQARKSCSGR
jgi:hypothetical protein